MTSGTNNSGTPKAAPKKRGCLFWFGIFAGISLVLLLSAAGVMWYVYTQAMTKPEFYKTRDAFIEKTGPVDLDRLANETEQRITDTITQPHSPSLTGGAFEVVLTYDQINAWLATRFAGWAKHQGMTLPGSVKSAMVTQEEGDLVFATEINDPGYKGVMSFRFHVELVEKGAEPSVVMVRLVHAKSGNIRVPITEESIRSRIPDETIKKWLEQLDKGYPVPAVAMLDPKSNRQIRLDKLDVTAEGLMVKMTELNGRTSVTTPAVRPVVPEPVAPADNNRESTRQ